MKPVAAVASANPWLPQMARLTSIRQELPNVATYEFVWSESDVQAEYAFQAGQFNMLYLPGCGEAAISMSSDPQETGSFLHTVRIAGNVTHAIARLSVGDEVGIRGPFGSSWPMEAARGNDIVIASGGIGLAPLRPAIYHLINHRDDYGRIFLLHGARTPSDLLYRDEFDVWRDAGIQVEVTVDLGTDDWSGNIGVVPALFYRLRLGAQSTRILTCGPEIMMRFVIFEALARKIAPQHIYLSIERNMRCAIGMCGHCQLGPSFVCKDGPVFTYERMEPYLRFEDL